ncbi:MULTISPECIES: hypothetical protein [unclassified Luteibacter]|uniref:hypothetical protein n=1 Tax=Luteibacter sp. PvP019 TaxID=3156436 RepID=UPI0033999512
MSMVVALALPFAAGAQTSAKPEDEYKKLIKVNEDIQPLGDTPFGEKISLYDGSLSFAQTDISLSGTGPALTLGRTFTFHGVQDRPDLQERAFGDWDIDLPQISTVTAQQNNVTGWQVAAGSPGAICSSFGPPPSVAAPTGDSKRSDWEPATWWQGYQLRIPGQGSQDLLGRSTANTTTPGVAGLTYPIVTRGNWAVGCLAHAANDTTIEGFLAVSPDGTKYWLDHIAYRYMPSLTRPLGSSSFAARSGFHVFASAEDFIKRREGRMLVTRIEDRFGNSVSYTYSGDDVTDIAASDGRHVTLTYETDASTGASSHRVSTITEQGGDAGNRTWTYSYVKSATNLVYTLTSVTQPDGSSWGYNLDSFNGAWPDSRGRGGTCAAIAEPGNADTPYTATVTHPSGLMASYTVMPLKRGRSYVPQECMAGPNLPAIPNGVSTWAAIPNASYGMAITQRTLSGTGLPANGLSWTYSYSPANESWSQDCATTACATQVSTDVSYPDGHLERSTFSNRYDWTESQLLKEDVYDSGASSAIRRSTAYAYVNPTPAQDARSGAYAHPWGYAPQERINTAQLQEQLPKATQQITMDPAASTTPDVYTWNATAFDAFARPQDVTRSNNFGYSVSDRSTYTDNAGLWVIGLPAQSINLSTGETVSQMLYDSATATPTERDRFGVKVMGYTFSAQGQLASFTDGNGKTTTLGNYTRGIPTSIGYPDGTSQAVTVDGLGQIAAIADQAGATTSYGYDAIGRIARIDYPTGDSTAWAPKTYSYVFSPDARGMGGNHWVRTTTQGNLNQRTDFDVLLRPVISTQSDATSGALAVSTRTGYDNAGRKSFVSYPVAGTPDRDSITQGTTTAYDALGRPTSSTQYDQDGNLVTTTLYLTGGARQVTDAKGNATFTHFQVFDTPGFDNVVKVEAPEGVTQTISRDLYGNVLSMTQGDLTRTMTYDDQHRLCRSWEPETGSTMAAYDGADNVVWSAAGQPFNGTGCGYDQVATAARTTNAYDAMNRVTSVAYPNGTLATSFTYDALGRPATSTSATSSSNANSTGTVGWSYGRNKLGLLTTEVLSVDGWSWTLGYGYDANGRLASVQYPDGQTVAMTSNALGQPTAAGSFASSATYYPDGVLEGFALGNGAAYSAAENTRLLLSSFSFGTGAQIAVSEGLSYDAVGNILSIDDQTGSKQRTRSMTYDGLSRLLSSHAENLWGTESYTYDTLNNLRSVTDSSGTKTYNYDANNLLSSISNNGATVHSFTYDAQGNTTAKDSQAMTFDLANRLLSVNGKGDYLYDATGHRVKAVTSAGTTYYAYSSSGQLMWEYDNGSTNGTSYIYLGKKLVASRKATTSTVMGYVDGVTSGADAVVSGWACASGLAASIDVHLYVGGPYGTGTGIAIATANQDTGSAVQELCHSSGTKHRYTITLTDEQRVKYAGQAIYVHGISPVGADNNLLTNSGNFVVPPSVLAPSSPASTTATAAGDLSSIAVNWSATSNTTSYKTECSTNGGAWATLYTGSGTSAFYNGPGDATYQFRTSACNANGCSTPTVSNTVTIAHIPPAPASINVPGNSTGSVAVSWPSTTYATSYQVDHSSDGNWTNVWAGTDTSTTVNEGASGNWSYRVRACNANGCGGYATSGAVNVILPPGTPTISGGGNNNTGAYTISWSAMNGAVSYNLIESANGGSIQQVQFNSSTSWSTSGRGNGNYSYQVQACSTLSCSPFSNATTVTVSLVPSAPAAPTFTTTYHGPTKPTVLVKWTAQSSATRYELMENNTLVYNDSGLSYSSLQQPGVTLTYKVRACNAVGCSAYSPSNSVSP